MTTDEAKQWVADTLNSIGKVAVKNFGSCSSSFVTLGVFYTTKKDLSPEDVVITVDWTGWRIKTEDDLT